MSRRRFDVIMTLSLRHVFVGMATDALTSCDFGTQQSKWRLYRMNGYLLSTRKDVKKNIMNLPCVVCEASVVG